MILVLFIILIAIMVANFVPGTYLSIWDTIHTEFNFSLDIHRSLFAVWQEYRGVGLLDGMAHAADLPRQLLLLVLSLFLPGNALRYTFHFLMLVVGATGVYTLLSRLVLSSKHPATKSAAAYLGTIFYLLNFGTIQYFYFPFESFSTFWGMFPWLFLVLFKTLVKPDRKHLLIFALVNLLATPAFYIQTMFIVYILCVLIILALHSVYRLWKVHLKLFTLILLVNSFWLLPSLYFFATHREIPREGKMNQMVTENTYLHNKFRGRLEDFVMLKGYYLDFVEEDGYLMEPWRQNFATTNATVVGLGLFGIVLLGMFKRHEYRPYILALFGLSTLVLLTDTYPVSLMQDLLRQSSALWDQVFRSPFTKFVVPAAWSFAIFFAIGTQIIMEAVGRVVNRPQLLSWLIVLIGTFFIGYTYFPAFEGQFFSPQARLSIPSEYLELFAYLNRQPSGRVATFPQPSYWGWVAYDWGYSGSGIIWQGVKQPVLDRAFDVWSPQSENYYWEINRVLSLQDTQALERVLAKYQITWLLIDDHTLSFPKKDKPDEYSIERLIAKSNTITLDKTFGKIRLYRVQNDAVKTFVGVSSTLPNIEPPTKWNDDDQAFADHGDYLSFPGSNKPQASSYYPFRSLFTGRGQSELAFGIENRRDAIVLTAIIPKSLVGTTLLLPQWSDKTPAPPEVVLDGEIVPYDPTAITLGAVPVSLSYITQGHLEIRLPKGVYASSLESSLGPEIYTAGAKSCDLVNHDFVQNEPFFDTHQRPYVRLTALSATNCFTIPATELTSAVGYAAFIDSRHIAGKSLLFWLESHGGTKTNLETYLSKDATWQTSALILPPIGGPNAGYTLHFWNTSIGREPTINDLGTVSAYPIPYNFLKSIQIVPATHTAAKTSSVSASATVLHPNPSFYVVSNQSSVISRQLSARSDQSPITLILSQAYDPGWHAYTLGCAITSARCKVQTVIPFVFGKKLDNHFVFNGWANAWSFDSAQDENSKFEIRNSKFVIIYLPQYLQYIGFVVVFGTVCYLIRSKSL